MDNKYKCVPFWSWNDELDEETLIKQIDWMHDNGVGGFFMHARGGLTTPYLGEKWFNCIEACLKRAKELDMEAYAYDENGWPSGFVGGKLLENINNRDCYVTYKMGEYDENAVISFDVSKDEIKQVRQGSNVMNMYINRSTSTVDILDPKVVDQFISLTHEQYKKHDKYKNLRGFFTDEPQYYRWGTPFTYMLEDYFKTHYNEDVYSRLALLFLEKEGYRDYRYKYFKALQDLMLNNFAKKIYDWCSSNGYKLTGHFVEEVTMGYQIMGCGGVMPFYEYEHIPGVDHLGRGVYNHIAYKQLGSVMAQLGKKQGIVEEFALSGWDATPMELKRIAEYYMVGGANLMCQHLLPYSEHGQRKRDYPEHFSIINPWVEKGFKDFNDYFSSINELLANSEEIVNVGLFEPIRTAYFTYLRDKENVGFNVETLDEDFRQINDELVKEGIPYHILDEVIMAKHGHVEGDILVVGKMKYKFIVIPKGTLTMDASTYRLFEEYARNGGKFLIVGDKPTYLEGKEFDHSYLNSNTSIKEIKQSLDFFSSRNDNIRIAYREKEDGTRFLYLMNLNDEDDIEIKVKGFNSFVDNGKIISNKIHLNKYESKILYFSNKEPTKEKKKQPLYLNNEFDLVNKVDNYLTLDYLCYSKDGINYSPYMHHMGAFNLLLQERYKGDIYLKYKFNSEIDSFSCAALIENTNIIDVHVNGNKAIHNGTVLEKDLYKYDIGKFIKKGENEVIIKINFFEDKNVYYALYGENVNESLRNCLVYNTTIEAIYLKGDFGVKGDFKEGETKGVLLGNNFTLVPQQTHLTCLIKDGFPFFRGNIKLKQLVNVNNVNKELTINERFQMIDLYVNGDYVKRMMFDYKADISKFLKVGQNEIVLDLVVSNRNLLGPFHCKDEECLGVGPYTFERMGSWKEDGTSDLCLPRYSFVKTII